MSSSFKQMCSLLVFLAASCVAGAQLIGAHATPGSPAEFARRFYDWYTPVALRENSEPSWNIALNLKRSIFSAELARLLKRDSDAQAACAELVGLDFDPILGSQEPAARYELGKSVQKGRDYLIEIYAVRYGVRSKSPDVTCEVAENKARFVFVNFLYPNGTDLLTILRSPRPKCSVPRSLNKKRVAQTPWFWESAALP
jgi:hypothetical protein